MPPASLRVEVRLSNIHSSNRGSGTDKLGRIGRIIHRNAGDFNPKCCDISDRAYLKRETWLNFGV